MSLELLAILSSISAFATSFIITKAANTSPRVPSFLYVHLPLYFMAFCYDRTMILGSLVASTYILIFTAGAAIYVWYNDLW